MGRLLCMAIVVIITGCASITGSKNQPISVTTINCDGANCTLKNDKGVYYIKETPGTVTVHKSGADLAIECEKDGKKGAMSVKSKANAGMWGNIILGGGIGAIVDASSGARFDYPNLITVPMVCEKKDG